MKLEILRRIDRWYIVTDGSRFGFGWDELMENDIEWYDTRSEAESAMLDFFEEEGTFSMPEPILNQTSAAEVLADMTGENWDRRKVHLYLKRGVLPEPDMFIRDVPHWKKSTIETYAKRRNLPERSDPGEVETDVDIE